MSLTYGRYLELLELLQGQSLKSASDLAEALSLSPRSVRRYIEELRLLGYDIEAVRGAAGGYRFKGNVSLPPMNFTDNEALALGYGLLLLKDSDELGKASRTALARLEPVLPANVLAKTRALQASVNVPPARRVVNAPSETLINLSSAITKTRRVQLRYHAPGKAPSKRAFDPYAVAHLIGLWFVAGYCHLRKDMRTFRIDRITELEPLDETFAAPSNFDVIQYVSDGIARTNRGNLTEVVIDLDLSLEDAQRRLPAGYMVIQPVSSGVRTTGYVKQLSDIVPFLAGSTFGFRIVKPQRLKTVLKEHLADVQGRLEETEGQG